MKTFKLLDKRCQGDVQELIDLIKAYLLLWGYSPNQLQLNHMQEMLSLIVKSKNDNV